LHLSATRQWPRPDTSAAAQVAARTFGTRHDLAVVPVQDGVSTFVYESTPDFFADSRKRLSGCW
jgi:hypothetical protein